jgi:hypothetical protein
MGAYKQLTTKDVVITPFWANKGFSFYGSQVTSSALGIEYYYGQELQSGSKLIYDPAGNFYKNIGTLDDGKNAYDQILGYLWALLGASPYYSSSLYVTGFNTKRNMFDVYYSAKQLYYSNFLTRSFGDLVATRSFHPNLDGDPQYDVSYGKPESPLYDNFLMNSLVPTRSWAGSPNSKTYFKPTYVSGQPNNNDIAVISIPSKLYGEAIEPGSFHLSFTTSYSNSAALSHVEYYVDLKDDEEGNIIGSLSQSAIGGANAKHGSGSYENIIVGNIIYPHGTIIVSDANVTPNTSSQFINKTLTPSAAAPNSTASLSTIIGITSNFNSDGLYPGSSYMKPGSILVNGNINSGSINFSSSLQMYEHQYRCTIRENEFGYSLNKTLLSASNGVNDLVYHDFATGSYFSPYVTTVGLYNKNKELLVVGKLSKATKIPMNADLTIQVNFDM